MLYICIFSNKFELKQTIRVLHNYAGSYYAECHYDGHHYAECHYTE
jgi:hypothetical protein